MTAQVLIIAFGCAAAGFMAYHDYRQTKTPEYMSAGKPVVSTSIRDVIRPYGQRGLVRIADSVPDFVAACEAAMAEDPAARVRDADAFLRQTSWDGTWAQMRQIVLATIHPSRPEARAASAV